MVIGVNGSTDGPDFGAGTSQADGGDASILPVSSHGVKSATASPDTVGPGDSLKLTGTAFNSDFAPGTGTGIRTFDVAWYINGGYLDGETVSIRPGQEETVSTTLPWEQISDEAGESGVIDFHVKGTSKHVSTQTAVEILEVDDGGPDDGDDSDDSDDNGDSDFPIPLLPAVGPLTQTQTTIAAILSGGLLLGVAK